MMIKRCEFKYCNSHLLLFHQANFLSSHQWRIFLPKKEKVITLLVINLGVPKSHIEYRISLQLVSILLYYVWENDSTQRTIMKQTNLLCETRSDILLNNNSKKSFLRSKMTLPLVLMCLRNKVLIRVNYKKIRMPLYFIWIENIGKLVIDKILLFTYIFIHFKGIKFKILN